MGAAVVFGSLTAEEGAGHGAHLDQPASGTRASREAASGCGPGVAAAELRASLARRAQELWRAESRPQGLRPSWQALSRAMRTAAEDVVGRNNRKWEVPMLARYEAQAKASRETLRRS